MTGVFNSYRCWFVRSFHVISFRKSCSTPKKIVSKKRKKNERDENEDIEEKGGERSGITTHGIHISRSTLKVVIECFGDVEDAFDVWHWEGEFLVDGEGLGGSDGVFDLQVTLVVVYD